MIKINNMVLNTDVSSIIFELKSQLAVSGFNMFNSIKISGDDIMTNCPFHKNGQEKKPSFGIHTGTGVCHCLACGYSASLPEAISNIFGKYDYGLFGADWLRHNFATVDVEERGEIDLDLNRKEVSKEVRYSYVPEMVLEQYRNWPTHPYLYRRKMTDDVIKMFDLGYDYETDCITFPVRDVYGNCLFIARRSVTGKYFNYPKCATKPLYGLFELYSSCFAEKVDVYITESMFNCLTLWTYGIPALALNGTGSKEQIEDLAKLSCRTYVLALDPDIAGQHGTERIINALKGKKMLRRLDYKDVTKDINDLSKDEFFDLPVTFI